MSSGSVAVRSRPWLPALVWLLVPAAVGAQSVIVDRDVPKDVEERRDFFALPYAFHSDVLSTAFGFAAGGRGIFQPQDVVVANLVGSTNGSFVTYLLGDGIRLPIGERLFVSPRIMVGDFGAIDTFAPGNPDFPDERAGSNGSDEDNFIRSEGTDQWYRLIFRYVLPLGHGRDTVVPTYVLDRGLLHEGETGGERWNPLTSGRTLLELEPFYREQDFDSDLGNDIAETGGVSLTLRHENVDFLTNPSRGSVQRFTVTHDWGVQNDESSYTVVEFEATKYFSLGESERFRQRVLALNLWTADTPTWETKQVGGREVIEHRPPSFAGATLGGIDRLRGYPTARFNDKAAIYYGAELRLIPHWNPLADLPVLRKLARVDWIQLVGFAELGRVADTWNVAELHDEMKWSAGVGLRGLVNNLLVRADVGFSSEGGEVQMMVSHPFPQL